MEPHEYAGLDATALADLIRDHQVSAEEVHTAAIAGLHAVNPDLNAIVGEVFDQPLAYDPGGPFAGVPFGIKDLLLTARGVPQESGSALTRGCIADHDTDLMGRFRAAGLATLCRTSTPEFGLSFTTEPTAGGATCNPYDPTATAGGSSGGAAALVAAGALPWAHANDAAGSIRIPAALCGLVGLKPSRGTVPVGPDSDEPLFGLTSEFALTRTVRDAVALFAHVRGSVPGDRYSNPTPPPGPHDGGGRGLRIAVSTEPIFATQVEPAVTEAVLRTARLLESLGHHVEYAAPLVDAEMLRETVVRFLSASAGHTLTELADNDLARALATVEHSTAAFARAGVALRWTDVAAARTWQNHLTRTAATFFADAYDVTLTPTTATTAWPIGALDGNVAGLTAHAWVDQLMLRTPFTVLSNVTGQPAISIPAGHHERRPIGVHLAAAQGGEHTLLALARQLERAQPWADDTPPIHVGNTAEAPHTQSTPRSGVRYLTEAPK